MTRYALLAAAAILSAATATQVFAQAAIQEPGVYAFYHPNADVLNAGAARPADAMASVNGGSVAQMQMSVRPHMVHAKRAAAVKHY
ncbi:hypothetical protein SAMN05444159_4973 [Bradyrhizobium lablabi]|uniref:Uncharacterized protein n=1 Tax=Bradyrhizobium lablabi TaxID=722472 RepID=A0A1M6XTV6_9BRAD|nr:hypothetical protein [Bradyrhizobium lablabi]SHL09303.1 hypothetical protein SAMN05444159_4973 [Bradyrhizobium lablabi]